MYTLIIFSGMLFLPLPLMVSAVRRGKNGYSAVFEGVFGVAIAMMLIFIIATVSGNPIGQAISKDLQSFCQVAASNEQFAAVLGIEKLALGERISALTQVYTYAINALPATLLVWTTIISYFEYLIVSKASQKAKYPLPMMGAIKDFSLPKKALWGWVIIYLMTLVVTLMGFPGSNVLQINIQVLFQFAFQIQGITVIFYFCNSKKWSRIIAVIICLLFLPTGIGQMLLCMMGFLDLGFGLRKIIARRR